MKITKTIICAATSCATFTAVAIATQLSSSPPANKAIALGCVLTYGTLVLLIILIVGTWSRLWKQWVLMFMATLLTFVLAEIGLRIIVPQKAMMQHRGIRSRQYHHAMLPNKRMFMRTFKDRQCVINTNEDGLRSSYSRDDFLSYDERVIVLGDSFAFGSGIKQTLVFPQILENELRQQTSQQNIAVLNAGHSSHSPFLFTLLFRGILKHYNPTLVILCLDATDIGDDIKYARESRTVNGAIVFPGQKIAKSEYYGAVMEVSRPLLRNIVKYIEYPMAIATGQSLSYTMSSKEKSDYYSFSLKITEEKTEDNRFFIYKHPLTKTRPYFMNTLTNINNLAKDITTTGAEFILVVSPRFHHWNTKECPNNWEAGYYGLDEPFQYEYFRFFEEASKDVDYPIVNLLPFFKATTEFPLVFDDDPHWNEKGHSFVGKTLAHIVMNQRVKDTAPPSEKNRKKQP